MGKLKHSIKSFLKLLPGLSDIAKSRYGLQFRHWLILKTAKRQSLTVTRFLRVPLQFEALTNNVIDYLSQETKVHHLNIIIAGCSNGAEAYTIASILKNKCQNISFNITAFDIDTDMLEKAKNRIYTKDEVWFNQFVTEEFVNDTFYPHSEGYIVKDEIAKNLKFEFINALDPHLLRKLGFADIIFAQNFLFHLVPKKATKAFENLCSLLSPRSAIFVDGMDLDLRISLTKAFKLKPLDYKIVEIHEQARVTKGTHWPWKYWGLETLDRSKKEWKSRYCTIFLHDSSANYRKASRH